MVYRWIDLTMQRAHVCFVGGKLCVLVCLLALVTNKACAVALILDDISNSYSSCLFQDNGNGFSTVSAVIEYKAVPRLNTGWQKEWAARAVALYTYDKNGKVKPSSFVATSVALNGVFSNDRYTGSGYSLYQRVARGGDGDWLNREQVSARFVALIPNSNLLDWPAVSLRAANSVYASSTGGDIAEIKGAAYIARNGSKDGTCKVIVSPETPPPLDTNITVSAPDWSLGELQQGLSDTPLTRPDQLLCFSYDAAEVQGQKFVIGASNANGVVNNRYQLRHLSDTSQVVPYSLTLNSGVELVQLPGNSSAIPLIDSGRTCFYPTFHTEVDKTVKEGDYSDVLNFTVTTKL